MPVSTADLIWRDYETDGDAGSGAHKPIKSEIRTWGTDKETRIGDNETSITDHETRITTLETAEATITAWGYQLIQTADEAALKTLINLEIDTDVLAYNANLSAIGDLAWAANNYLYYDGTNFQLGDLTALPSLSASNTFVGASQTFQQNDDGAGIGPTAILFRNSASPTASDALGAISFKGNNSSAVSVAYASITSAIIDPTNGSEDGSLQVKAYKAGVSTQEALFGPGLAIGASTGGAQGTGTINATAYYKDGAPLDLPRLIPIESSGPLGGTSSCEFTTNISSTYIAFLLVGIGITTVSGTSGLVLDLSSDGGATWPRSLTLSPVAGTANGQWWINSVTTGDKPALTGSTGASGAVNDEESSAFTANAFRARMVTVNFGSGEFHLYGLEAP